MQIDTQTKQQVLLDWSEELVENLPSALCSVNQCSSDVLDVLNCDGWIIVKLVSSQY